MTTPGDADVFPYVAVYAQTTGIHPTTGRLLTLDAVAFDDDGNLGEDFHAVFNTGEDAGPRHNHGLELSDFAQAPRFSRHLKTLNRLIDKRTLVLHDTPYTWGFIVSESRRAMNAAARANRSRGGRNGRRRQRVGHIPRPESIADTLASARRQGVIPPDIRINAVAKLLNVPARDPVASVERAARSEADTSREHTLTVIDLFLTLKERGPVTSVSTEELMPDRFGLQRSIVRAQAEKDSPETDNPGPYTTESGLQRGMEIVVSDDVSRDPSAIIAIALELGLTYTEKLSRQTSLVISDALAAGAPLCGKAMHAARKSIPILSTAQFDEAVARMNSK